MTRAIRLLALAALLAIGVASCDRDHDDDRKPAASSHVTRPPVEVAQDAAGDTVITLSNEAQRRAGIEIRPLRASDQVAEIVAYGRLEADPDAEFTVNAPVAGTVAASGRSWPRLGAHLAAGTAVGDLVPRLAPADQIALSAQLATARGEVASAQATLVAARSAYQRAKILNADGKNVSDRALQIARATMVSDQARLVAARQTTTLLGQALGSRSGRTLALSTPRSGEVVQVLVTPGEAVQAGQAVLKIEDFGHLLAKVEIPAGEDAPGPDATARIVPVGRDDLSIPAVPTALGADVDSQAQGEVRIFRLSEGNSRLRPGMGITAYLAEPGSPAPGVLIPESALVFTEGKTWAYVEEGQGSFMRRPVATDRPAPGGYLAGMGFKPGDRLVTAGAGALLSEESRSQIQAGDSDDPGDSGDSGDGDKADKGKDGGD